MNQLVLTVFVLLLSKICLSQNSPGITCYFDKNWKVVEDSSNATYYRVTEEEDNLYLVKDYFMSGRIQMLAHCKEISPRLKMHGETIYYFPNGNIKEKGKYKNGESLGVFDYYYESGKLREQVRYDGFNMTYLTYLSEDGTDLLANGNGLILQDTSTPEVLRYTEVRDRQNVASYNVTVATSDTIYTKTDKAPEYIGGTIKLSRDIRANMRYPKDARKTKQAGTAYIQFVVDKTGVIREASVIRGFYPSCDEAALEAVKSLSRWQPGSHKGKIVAVRYVLPVKFSP
jgi:protein TonB